VIQTGDKVDAFDIPLLEMIVVPANDVVFIGVWLFGNAVIHNHDTVFIFDFANMWLRNPPQVGRGLFFACQPMLGLVVADFTFQQ